MTDTITLPRVTVQQALEALEADNIKLWSSYKRTTAYFNLRNALEQQAEPVAWGMAQKDGLILDVICPEEHQSYEGEYTIPLYTGQPQRKPLTDEEIDQLLPEIVSGGSFTVITYGRAVARAIEAAHGIKEPKP